MERTEAVWAVVIMAAVTILLRFAPFIILSKGKKTPDIVLYLGRVLPGAIMGMLVVFCLKDTSFASVSGFLPQLIAAAAVVFSYLWKKNTLLSIIAGTAIYMLII